MKVSKASLTAVLLLASGGCRGVTISGIGSSGGNASGTPASSAGATGGSSGGAGTTSTGTGTGAPLTSVGPCTSNTQCVSGVCGLDGTGNCCSAICSIVTPPCGATGCEGQTGACVFPDAGVACGGFTCAQCVGGSFCDTLNAACCSGLAAGGTIHADSQRGYDGSACCGIDKNRPCQTITQAMKLIDSAQARDVTIEAAVFFDGGRWDEDGTETYPIVLGWGAELKAPGILFVAETKNPAEVFDVKRYSPDDAVGYASLTGAPGLPVAVGYNAAAIQVESGSHLYLANADLLAENGIYLLPLASLTLGQDQVASVVGTVTIGKAPASGATYSGVFGIRCFTDDAGNGCTIDDAPLEGESSVIIQNQGAADIYAEDGAVISLTSSPVIGVAPTAVGFQHCSSNLDSGGAAVYLLGRSTMTFENGAVQCIVHSGFVVQASSIGAPSLTIENSVIQNTSIGIVAMGGSVTVANSAIRFNADGVEVEYDAGVDLSGGKIGGVNTIACNLLDERGGGVSVENNGYHVVNASNVAWDTPSPNVFVWSDAGTYVCAAADCTALGDAGVVMDAVVFSAGIITTGHTLSPLQCGQ